MRDKDLFAPESSGPAREPRTGRFILTYASLDDPSPEAMSRAVASLSGHHVVEVMPGTILVEGDEAAIAASVRNLPSWNVEPERWLTSDPPHKRWVAS
jgi:hypothetical protein